MLLADFFRERTAAPEWAASVFVFATDVAAKKWADWVVTNTAVRAVAMEQFIAWDTFKGECVRADDAALSAVPALMRKVFVSGLLERNVRAPFLAHLIPQEKARYSAAFADYLAGILPSLKLWKQLYDHQDAPIAFDGGADDAALKLFYEDYKAHGFKDDEDADLLALYAAYDGFLRETGRFDPAWIEPDFSKSGAGTHFFIMFPEILEDWAQYEPKLRGIPTVHIVGVPPAPAEHYESFIFDNARLELRDVAAFLRQQHDEHGIAWADMAVSVPNMEHYGTYLDRELDLHEIPHSMRYSRTLSEYGAGSVFAAVQDCVSDNFSYESVKTLLLNEEIPWRQPFVIENLLLFGKKNNCLCSYKSAANPMNLTVWELAFQTYRDDDRTGLNKDELIRAFFAALTERARALVAAPTFAALRTEYDKFRAEFFDMAAFQTDARFSLSNNVLSRCVSALNQMQDLEREFSGFPGYSVASPFGFYVNHLSSVQYLAQGRNNFVQVFPYRTAACAPYRVHIVVDATQDALSVAESFKPLRFLNENKRRIFAKLGAADDALRFYDADPTFDFIKLYQHNAAGGAHFTASKHSFNGSYGFAHGKLCTKPGQDAHGNYGEEARAFAGEAAGGHAPAELFAKQRRGFSAWLGRTRSFAGASGADARADVGAQLKARLSYTKPDAPRAAHLDGRLLQKYKVTQTMLKNFFKCPRKWLFRDVLKLAPLDNEAALIDEFIMGTVNHKVFELFLTKLKNEQKSLRTADADPTALPEEYREFLRAAMNMAVEAAPADESFTDGGTASAFKTEWKTNSVSLMTMNVIRAQYRQTAGQSAGHDDAASATTLQFRALEKSLAVLSALFPGHYVHAMELELNAFPPTPGAADAETAPEGASGTTKSSAESSVAAENPSSRYYFNGKIDCVLTNPSRTEFTIVDFKTSALPKNTDVQPEEAGKRERIIDFQMPMYLYLAAHALELEAPLAVTNALFFSIKKRAAKFFLGDAPEGGDGKSESRAANAELCRAELCARTEQFMRAVLAQDFSVSCRNQGEAVCTSKSEFDNCIDYQAICRRYFTVEGEPLK